MPDWGCVKLFRPPPTEIRSLDIDLSDLLRLCGVAHVALGLGSAVIPKLLDWRSALATTPVLIRQMFWTYAGYILCINLFFGVVSLLLPDELLSGSGLAVALSGLIAAYWFGRLVIQFVYFDKTDVPTGGIYTFGEYGLVGLFVLFTVAYSYALYVNLTSVAS